MSPPLSSGFDPTDFSSSVRAQDDLYEYLNGGWLERTTLPEDKARYGTFDILADGAELAIREILEESRTAPEGSEARKVGDLYSSFLDEERVNLLGVGPLVDRLAQVNAVTSINELLALIGRLQRRGVGGFYALFVDNDPGDPDRYVTILEQGGLSLPDESYYREEHFASIREAFVAHVARMFELASVTDAAGRAATDLRAGDEGRRWSLEQRRLARQREDLQPEVVGRGLRAVRGDAARGVAQRARGAGRRLRRGRPSPAQFRQRRGSAADRLPPRVLEGLAVVADHRRGRAVPLHRVRRRTLRLLWSHADRGRSDPPALEARRRPRRRGHGRSHRQDLRGTPLPARSEGSHGRAWSPTSSRPIDEASPTSSGWGRRRDVEPWKSSTPSRLRSATRCAGATTRPCASRRTTSWPTCGRPVSSSSSAT